MPKRPIRVLQQHFEDKSNVLFKASNHQKGFREIQISFKTSSASKEALALSLFKQGSSLKEFSSLLHLRLKSTKNETLLDQA
jgi:hypothetical protein